MVPEAERPERDPASRAGAAIAGPLLWPDRVANALRVERKHETGLDVEVEFVAELDREAEVSDEPSEETKEWLEDRDYVITESGGQILEHLIIPCEVSLDKENVIAVRDCRFLVIEYSNATDRQG